MLLAVTVVAVTGCGYYQRTIKFGGVPTDERLERMQNSPNYQDGEFKNNESAPSPAQRSSSLRRLIRHLTAEKDRPRPPYPVPTVKTDLKALDANEDLVIWLGHASFYLQLAGRRILIDPIFSESAAPAPFRIKAFSGTNIYTAENMPNIDLLLITHDHWDHLDYATVTALKDKTDKVICALGVGAHFERWGFAEDSVVETDWHDVIWLDDSLAVHTLPARHFSGRTLMRNTTLWAGYALITPDHKIYISGDTGYGSHFQEAGRAFDGFDLAMLDIGQYNDRWPHSHMTPEEGIKAAHNLRAKALLPMHIGKFSLALHPWDEPFIRITQAAQEAPFQLITPRIGEPVRLDRVERQQFSRWWEELGE